SEVVQELAHELASRPVEIFAVEQGMFGRVPAFKSHFERAGVPSDRVLLVERNVAHHIPLENAVLFCRGVAEPILSGIVDVDAVENREFRDERILSINPKNDAAKITAADRKEPSAGISASGIGLRQRDFIGN